GLEMISHCRRPYAPPVGSVALPQDVIERKLPTTRALASLDAGDASRNENMMASKELHVGARREQSPVSFSIHAVGAPDDLKPRTS
ncbi:MAG: hypothetical protein ACRDH5_10460, partial [bacterium]